MSALFVALIDWFILPETLDGSATGFRSWSDQSLNVGFYWPNSCDTKAKAAALDRTKDKVGATSPLPHAMFTFGLLTQGKTGRKHGNTGWSAGLLRKKTGMIELTGFQKKHVKKYVPFKQSP